MHIHEENYILHKILKFVDTLEHISRKYAV